MSDGTGVILRVPFRIVDAHEKAISDSVKAGLEKKVEEHNEDVGDSKTKRTNLRTLTAVFERGIGAYETNPSSVRPTVSSAEQWAYARVNSFLYVLRNGKFKSGKHDTDLLPEGHPQSTKDAVSDFNKGEFGKHCEDVMEDGYGMYEEDNLHDDGYAFDNAEDAIAMSERIEATGAVCSAFHGHIGPDGETIYMPCSSHDEMIEAISEMEAWHDEEDDKTKIYDKINFKPTAAMAEEAERGLAWRKEHNRGGTSIGVARARQLMNRQTLSPRTVRRMRSYFARHEVDKQGEGWSPSEDGYPSAGRIAWALWGGDAGRSWANARVRSMDAEDEREGRFSEQEYAKNSDLVGDAPEIEIGKGVLIEGPVSSGVTDRDGDVVEPEAVMKAWGDYQKNPIILHNHERGGIGRMIDVRMGEWDGIDHPVPIGRALIDESEKSVVNKIRKGIIRAFSIGFIARAGGVEKIETETGGMAHRFTSIDWVETSVVDIPSNPVALFDVVKNREVVLAKSTAPVSFNSPFAVRTFQQGTKTMTDIEASELAQTEEEVVETPVVEETATESEVVEEATEIKFVSEEEFKSLESKVDDILEGMMALKEMSSEPQEESEESDELTQLKAENEALKAEKAAAEIEARIASEVEARVKSIMGDTPVSTPERKPERKSVAGVTIKESDFEEVAQERGVSIGAVKGEAWLASLLSSRRKN